MSHFTLVVETDPHQHHHQPPLEEILAEAVKEAEAKGHRIKRAYLLDAAGHHHQIKADVAT